MTAPKPLAICAYCGAHGHDDLRLIGWTQVDEPDGPPRGLPAQWWCCVKCFGNDVPHQMRVRRRFDYVVIDLFTWWARWGTPELEARLRGIDPDALWLLGDLVARGVLTTREIRRPSGDGLVLYYDPAPIWRRIISRVRRWWRARK